MVYLERWKGFNVGGNWGSQMVSKMVLKSPQARRKQGYLSKDDGWMKAGYLWGRLETVTGKLPRELRRWMTVNLRLWQELHNAPTQNYLTTPTHTTFRSPYVQSSPLSHKQAAKIKENKLILSCQDWESKF